MGVHPVPGPDVVRQYGDDNKFRSCVALSHQLRDFLPGKHGYVSHDNADRSEDEIRSQRSPVTLAP